MSGNLELDYIINEEKSDVVFFVEGQPIPAFKVVLSLKNRVFKDMFSGDINQSEARVIVIEDSTYEAFKTLIRFLYFDVLVLKDDTDIELIKELYKLSDKYLVPKLKDRITDLLLIKSEMAKEYSPEGFENKWLTIRRIGKIAFDLKITALMNNVMTFIDKHLGLFVKRDREGLNKLNDVTDGHFLYVMANKCRKLFDLLDRIRRCLKQVKMFECYRCQAINHVQSVSFSTKCSECKANFY